MKNLVLDTTKTCQMTHLTKMMMKEMSRRERLGMLLTKSHILAYSQLPTVLNELRTVINGKSVHFLFRIVWVLYTFLQ